MNNLNITSSAIARSTRSARLAAVAALLGGVTVGALAQYKIVGPDGKVTYTDKAPTAQDVRPASGGAAPTGGGMPYETRQAMSKYPVTLYSMASCPNCDQARQALRTRGVPFNEYSVSTDSDFAVFQSRFGTSTFPVVSIGSQSLKTYTPSDLASYLDAAGYPAQARLAGYAWPAAVPLAPRGAATAANNVAPTPAAPAASAPLLPPPSKNGIQF